MTKVANKIVKKKEFEKTGKVPSRRQVLFYIQAAIFPPATLDLIARQLNKNKGVSEESSNPQAYLIIS